MTNKIILKPKNFVFLPKSCDCKRIKVLACYLGQVQKQTSGLDFSRCFVCIDRVQIEIMNAVVKLAQLIFT